MASPRLYIGGAAVSAYDMDAATGKITPIGEPLEVDGSGSFIWPNAAGTVLYAVAGPGMASFSIDAATGALSHVNTVANELDGNSHITTNGEVVIAAAYGGADGATSGVNVAKIASGGELEEGVTATPHSGGSGVHPGAEACQDGSHCHSAYVDPAGAYVLVRPLLLFSLRLTLTRGGLASLSTAHGHVRCHCRCRTSARTRSTRTPSTTPATPSPSI